MEEDESTEEYYDDLTHDDIQLIQEEYRRKKIREALIGPIISTAFHIVLIILLALTITDKYKQETPDIEVVIENLEEIVLEEPPPIEEPEPVDEPVSDVTDPVLTTVAIENVETNDAALEDTNDEAPSTDDDSMVESVSDVTVSPSAFASPNVYGGRSAAGRASSVSKFGGSKVGQQSLMKALLWLQKVQNADGSWGKKKRTGITGLALLTFLAHGETHLSKQFGLTVKKAIQWLTYDKAMTGKGHEGYALAIKAYALSEAYAMTGISIIAPQMNLCMKYIIDNQQDAGSFDYNYNKSTDRQDLSLAGWHYQAMKAAYGAGCEVDGLTEAIQKSIQWLKKSGGSQKSFTYVTVGNDFDGAKIERQKSMRAVGSLCLQLFGEGNCAEIKDDLVKIATEDLETLTWQPKHQFSLYGWYYATQAMFQHGGPSWKKWNNKFQKLLITNQHQEGYWEYPKIANFIPQYLGSVTAERVYATTLASLMLTVYYHLL
ncbi:MAG: hypothetical protein NE330_01840 [Lentisphaeraceae bacterium]|nr:hypothetical protein [Lentisphaeraceae bacterium]